jgi:hypothetical protein
MNTTKSPPTGLVDVPLAEGEDEPWSPTSVAFALTAAQLANIDKDSLVCDLAAGGAASSIAIAERTGARIHAVDSSDIAIASILKRSRDHLVSERILPIQLDALGYVDKASTEGLRYDLVIKPRGFLVLSGYAYSGVTEQPFPTSRIASNVPEDIREHYENTMHSAKRREILDEQQLLRLVKTAGFTTRLNFRVGQNHWSSYFERMQRMAEQGVDVARQHHSASRRFGIGEAYHNLRGQHYLCYAVVIAQASRGKAANRQPSGEG